MPTQPTEHIRKKDEENIPNPTQILETWKKIEAAKNAQDTNQNSQIEAEETQDKPEADSSSTNKPHPVVSTPKEQDQKSNIQKMEGAYVPQSFRPHPQKPVKEDGSVIVAKGLAEQLGTAPEIKAQMRIDERKLAVLTPATLSALSHFAFRHVYDGIRYWGHTVEWELVGSQGVGGLGRRHILTAIANSSGTQAIEKAQKPNALARNIWDRDWKKKAEKEGKLVDE